MSKANKANKPNNQAQLPTLDPLEKLIEMQERQNEAILNLGKAIVALNEKVEALKGSGRGGASDIIGAIKDLAQGGGGLSTEEFVKQAEAIARAGEAIDRLRHPVDVEGLLAKRMLWKQGIRGTSLPRYMTKEELKRYDRLVSQTLGLEEFEQEGEGQGHGAPE